MHICVKQNHCICLPFPGEYIYLENNSCGGSAIESFSTRQAAIEACGNNNECDCLDDTECNGDEWWTYEASTNASTEGSCAWIKGIPITSYRRKVLDNVELIT